MVVRRKPPKSTEIVGRDGPPCPRCHNLTQIREHKTIGRKQLKRPFYYSRWYYCPNRQCVTTLIMPTEFKVWNEERPLEVPRTPTLELGDDVVMDVLTQSGPPPWENA